MLRRDLFKSLFFALLSFFGFKHKKPEVSARIEPLEALPGKWCWTRYYTKSALLSWDNIVTGGLLAKGVELVADEPVDQVREYKGRIRSIVGPVDVVNAFLDKFGDVMKAQENQLYFLVDDEDSRDKACCEPHNLLWFKVSKLVLRSLGMTVTSDGVAHCSDVDFLFVGHPVLVGNNKIELHHVQDKRITVHRSCL